jgi:hypothetical protein
MTHLLLHKTPNLVSSEPGAAQISEFRQNPWIGSAPWRSDGLLNVSASEKPQAIFKHCLFCTKFFGQLCRYRFVQRPQTLGCQQFKIGLLHDDPDSWLELSSRIKVMVK